MPAILRFVSLPLLALAALSFSTTDAASVSVSLRWTAPGDDGYVGRATAYDLRYSTVPLTDATFVTAIPFAGVPFPSLAGARDSCTVTGLSPDVAYYFALRARDEAGNWSQISNVVLARNGSVAGGAGEGLTLSFGPAFPNPASQGTRFALTLPVAGRLLVSVFDVMGRRVRVLLDGALAAGRRDLSWDLRDDQGGPVSAGWYAVRAELPGRVETRRILVTR